jgi:serine/threonine protein kinase
MEFDPTIQYCVGSGGYARVFKKVLDGHFFAFKKYKNNTEKTDGLDRSAMIEIAILKRIRHPNIVQYIDHDLNGNSLTTAFVEPGCLNIDENYSPIQMRAIIIGLIRGIEFIHSLDIIHRDIKPENVLFDARNNSLKIADFGSARIHASSLFVDSSLWASAVHDLSHSVTTLPFRSPEALLHFTSSMGKETDIWSVGVLLFLLFTKENFVDYSANSNADVIKNIFYRLGTPTASNGYMPSLVNKFSEKDILRKYGKIYIRTFYPQSLIENTSDGRGETDWGIPLTTAISLLEMTLVLEPSQRASARILSQIISNNFSYPNISWQLIPPPTATIQPTVLQFRRKLDKWAYQICFFSQSHACRRILHCFCSILDALFSTPEIESIINDTRAVAVIMSTIRFISSKIMHWNYTSPSFYNILKTRIVRANKTWFGINDDKITDQEVFGMEKLITRMVDFNFFTTLPIDLINPESDTLHLCQNVDMMVCKGFNIHTGDNASMVVTAARWLHYNGRPSVLVQPCNPRIKEILEVFFEN